MEGKAIVTTKPVLHVVLLHVWAFIVDMLLQTANYSNSELFYPMEGILLSKDIQFLHDQPQEPRSDNSNSEDTAEPLAKNNLLSAFDVAGSQHDSAFTLPPRPPKNVVSIPTSFQAQDNVTPLVTTLVRRSPRLNKLDGYQHCQYAPMEKIQKSTRCLKQPATKAN
jgi:hypothetical protein